MRAASSSREMVGAGPASRATSTPFALSSASADATTSAEEDDNPEAIGTSPVTVPSMPRSNRTPCSSSPLAAART